MKAIRRILVPSLILICAIGTILCSGCKNKCGSTTCQNGGSCADNVCICPTGYSGNSCQTGWSDAIVGTYNCSRSNCKPAVAGINSWVSSITKDATNGGYTIDISNFDNSNTTIVGNIDSAINGISRITISPAVVSSGGIDASGTFDVNNNTVSLQFTTASPTGGAAYSCEMTMVKEQ